MKEIVQTANTTYNPHFCRLIEKDVLSGKDPVNGKTLVKKDVSFLYCYCCEM